MKINEQLKKHRLQHKLTQEDVAQKLHVTRATISSWETGRTFPDIEKLIYLSDLYGLSLDQLIREEPKIMTNIQKERKSLRSWKVVKRILLGIAAIVILYLALWLSFIGTKNRNLDTLDGWKKTGTHYTYKTDEKMFNSRKIPFPRFDDGGTVYVNGGYITPKRDDRISVMISGSQGEVIIVGWGDLITSTVEDEELRPYTRGVQITDQGSFLNGTNLEFFDRMTIDKIENIHRDLLETHKDEVLANYELVLAEWQRVNNRQ